MTKKDPQRAVFFGIKYKIKKKRKKFKKCLTYKIICDIMFRLSVVAAPFFRRVTED